MYIYALSICAAIAWWLKGLKESWTTINLNMNPYQGLNKSHWTVGVYLLGYPTIYESWVRRFDSNAKDIWNQYIGNFIEAWTSTVNIVKLKLLAFSGLIPEFGWLSSKLRVILFRACYTPHAASLVPLNPALASGAGDRSSPVRCCRCSRCPPSWCRCWCGRPGAETGQKIRKTWDFANEQMGI